MSFTGMIGENVYLDGSQEPGLDLRSMIPKHAAFGGTFSV